LLVWPDDAPHLSRRCRDPHTLRRSWCGGCVCAPTQAQAERIAGERYRSDTLDDFDFVSTPA
jgi:hypothetical protein